MLRFLFLLRQPEEKRYAYSKFLNLRSLGYQLYSSPMSHTGPLSQLVCWVNSLPHNIFAWSYLKELADDKIKEAQTMYFVLVRLENILGKRKNAGRRLKLESCGKGLKA